MCESGGRRMGAASRTAAVVACVRFAEATPRALPVDGPLPCARCAWRCCPSTATVWAAPRGASPLQSAARRGAAPKRGAASRDDQRDGGSNVADGGVTSAHDRVGTGTGVAGAGDNPSSRRPLGLASRSSCAAWSLGCSSCCAVSMATDRGGNADAAEAEGATATSSRRGLKSTATPPLAGLRVALDAAAEGNINGNITTTYVP